MGVHPDAGAGVDLDDDGVVLAEWHRDVGSEDIDAGDVESDDAGSHLASGDVVGMHFVRAVDGGAARGKVRGPAQIHWLIFGGNRLER